MIDQEGLSEEVLSRQPEILGLTSRTIAGSQRSVLQTTSLPLANQGNGYVAIAWGSLQLASALS